MAKVSTLFCVGEILGRSAIALSMDIIWACMQTSDHAVSLAYYLATIDSTFESSLCSLFGILWIQNCQHNHDCIPIFINMKLV